MTWPYVERAQARIELVLTRLAQAKNEKDPIELGQADAVALYDVAAAAEQDLGDLLAALREAGEPPRGVAERFHRTKV